ncbi:MAG TPA: hypothetical protein VFO85_21895 [Vicinamibacteria bacterium]|nr:hypothetical protein [Vicinamibacteria bacterium]
MNAHVRARRLRVRALLVTGLFALIVLGAPLLHHDFACHQKSPTHCVACVSSPSAPRAVAKVAVAPELTVLGGVVEEGRRLFRERPLLSVPGRAPPA